MLLRDFFFFFWQKLERTGLCFIAVGKTAISKNEKKNKTHEKLREENEEGEEGRKKRKTSGTAKQTTPQNTQRGGGEWG